MAKPLKKIVEYPKDSDAMHKRLRQLSVQYGGAWIANIMPFSHETHFTMFKNRSSVPDYFSDWTHGEMAVGGKIVGFTDAAKIREQRRGYSRDS